MRASTSISASDSDYASRRVTPLEWRWTLIASVILLALFSAPYALGWSNSSARAQFSGFLIGIEDMNSYLAKMRYGARDGWNLELVYTSEPHQGGFVYAPLLAIGKLAAALSGEGSHVSMSALVTAYHAARLLCGLLLLTMIYRFVAEFMVDVGQRRAAWLLASIGGGLGWIMLFVNPSMRIMAGLPIELYVPEAYNALLIYSFPHLALARSLMLGGWLLLFAALRDRDWRKTLLAGVAWLGMGLCVPFYVALLGALLAAWLIGLMIVHRKIPISEIAFAFLAGALPLAYLIYNAWLFTTNPIFAIWSAQNMLPSPQLLDYVLGYGALLALAIPAAQGLIKNGLQRRATVLIIWPIVAAALVYAPINVQRRLLEGAYIPLSILAVAGLTRLTESRGAWARRAAIAFMALLLPSTAMLLLTGVAAASSRTWPVFHPAPELAALGWLDANVPSDSVVLSTRDSGMVLPVFSNVRTYLGHGPETAHYLDKERVVGEMLSSTDNAPRDRFFADNVIDYVWVGPPESALCGQPLCAGQFPSPAFKVVFSNGDYSIYQVER